MRGEENVAARFQNKHEANASDHEASCKSSCARNVVLRDRSEARLGVHRSGAVCSAGLWPTLSQLLA